MVRDSSHICLQLLNGHRVRSNRLVQRWTTSFIFFSTLSDPSTLLRIRASIAFVREFLGSSLCSFGFWRSRGSTYQSLSPSRSFQLVPRSCHSLSRSLQPSSPLYSNLGSHPALDSSNRNLFLDFPENVLPHCKKPQSVHQGSPH